MLFHCVQSNKQTSWKTWNKCKFAENRCHDTQTKVSQPNDKQPKLVTAILNWNEIFWYSTKMVWCKIQMSLKIGSFKSICFGPKSLVYGFIKFCCKFWSLCLYGSECNETKRQFMLKKAPFSLLSQSTTPLKWIWNENVQTLQQN